jgi:hypothetical protein
MCIGVYWVGLGWILTCYGFKPAQSHPIHVDYHQNEQALIWRCGHRAVAPCMPGGVIDVVRFALLVLDHQK